MTAADTAKKFTPTEQRIVDLLADGFAHSAKEVKACLDDELADDATVRVHVCKLRKKLPRQFGVFHDATNGTPKWRMVRFIGGAGE